MRYGRILYKNEFSHNCCEEERCNIGDYFQIYVIEYLYSICGIDQSDVIDISINELMNYDGDYVIVPVVGGLLSCFEFNQLSASSRIIPFFVSSEFGHTASRDIAFHLKKWEPIGVSDEVSLDNLRRIGVEAFLCGCLTITLPKRESVPKKKKVFLVDVDDDAMKFIPKEYLDISEEINYVGQVKQLLIDDIEKKGFDGIVRETIERIRSEATIVITSCVQAAASAMAMGIPTIFMSEKIDRRFAWLEKIIPLYDRACYDMIDWTPNVADIEDIKLELIGLFKTGLENLTNKYERWTNLSRFWENQGRLQYDRIVLNQLEEISNRYNSKDSFRYGIWGMGAYGDRVCEIMALHFPNAKLTVVVDSYLNWDLFGYEVISQEKVLGDEFDYMIISASEGRFKAKRCMKELGRQYKKDYCYFIPQTEQSDLIKKEWDSHGIIESDMDCVNPFLMTWILYGANDYLKSVLKTLRNNNISIGCIVDKRAEDLKEIQGIPVFTEEDIREYGTHQDLLVFMLLQNAMQHDEIAERLSSFGYERIVYVPMSDVPGNTKASQLRNIYNLVMLGDLLSIRGIPRYDQKIYSEWTVGDIIFESINFVTTIIPAEIVYTNPKWVCAGRSELLKYADIPLIEYTPYIELMKWLFGEEADLTEYLNDYGVNSCKYNNEYTDNTILNRRKQLFELWEKHYAANDKLFEDSAPLVEYNLKGYFNLLEGQHRSLFLIKKGCTMIPVRMKKSDFEKWQVLC